MDSDLLADLDDLGDEKEDTSQEESDVDENMDIGEQMTAGHKLLLESVKGVDQVFNLVKLHNSPQLVHVKEVCYFGFSNS